MTRILGIDPGSRTTGYGVLRAAGGRLELVDCGCIRTPEGAHPERLRRIFAGLSEVIGERAPEQAAVERVFLGRNADSALKLGQARGSAMAACGFHGLPVAEYGARQVKQAVSGFGAADKGQVQYMVKMILGISGGLPEDAADALAVAICHANARRPGAAAGGGGRA